MKHRLVSPRHLIVLLTAAMMLMMVGVSTTVVRAQTACSPSHVVQPGENLFRIALAAGTTWPVLQQINGIADPNLIFVGQVICLPGSVTAMMASRVSKGLKATLIFASDCLKMDPQTKKAAP